MFPVLFSLGPFAITSFGLFAALGFVLAVFSVWRLAKVYDVDEGKMIDLAIFTFIGSLIGARIFFVLTNLYLFPEWSRIFAITRYPGLSFWGGLLGGVLVFRLMLLKGKLSFWQVADFASAGLLLALAIGDLGCFLGGCAYGVTSNLPFAFPVAGILGKRLPISLFEALAFFMIFSYLWGQVIRFHFAGKITAWALILLGFIKFITEFWRGDRTFIYGWLSYGLVFSVLLLIAGIYIYYNCSKKSFTLDLKSFGEIFTSAKRREILTLNLKKGWYNQKVSWKIKVNKLKSVLSSLPRFFKRRLNVKPTPEKYR